jgi:ABC-type sulfate/molybdate transport systems ATPase subunit
MTLQENLRFAGAASPDKTRGLNRRRRVSELLQAFELADLGNRLPSQLSGGQKQRAALARILVTEPRVLLLDEPTRGLDIRLRASFYELLKQTGDRLGIPIVLVTHDLEECFELADEVCIIDNGVFLQTGSRDSVLNRPASPEIAQSLAIYNLAPAEIEFLDPGQNLSRLRVFGQEIEGPYIPGHLLGDRGFLCVRQADVMVAKPRNGTYPNQIVLALVRASYSAAGVRLQLEHEFSALVPEAVYEQLRGSERLALQFPPAAVHFIGK